MSVNCKFRIKGALDQYCPFNLNSSDRICRKISSPSCSGELAWDEAQKQVNFKLIPPRLKRNHQFDDHRVVFDILLAGRKILLVDDTPVSLKLLCKILKPYADLILTATHGRDALWMVENHQDIGIIFLDLDMPVMNGIEFVETLNASDKYKNRDITIVLVSTLTSYSDVKKSIALGITSHVKKPYTPDELFMTAIESMMCHAENKLMK